MIEFRDVALRYDGRERRAVDGVSFTAPTGAITAIVGPNGSGKSTLVRALLGRLRCESGSVLVEQRDRARMTQREFARAVAVVPQREDAAFPMSVREYVALGRLPHTGAWRGESGADVRAIDAALARTETAALASRATDELSGGEWQRVRVARALTQETRALVLDEPTTFLDIAHEMALFELAASLAGSGIAVMLVSHQLNLVARFATQMVLLSEGRVAAAGLPDDVMSAAVLERTYDWPLVVTRDAATGAPSVVPLRKTSINKPSIQ